MIVALSLVATAVQAAGPISLFYLSQGKYTWNGVAVADSEIFTPAVSEDGSFTIPVTAPKDGRLPWTFEGAFSPESIELGKARGLSFTGPDAKTLVLVSPNNGVGVANSFYFPLTSKMKTLTFQIAGTNSFSGAYAELLIDGKSMFRQSPESIARFSQISWDVSKYVDVNVPKLARLRLVDRDASSVLCAQAAIIAPSVIAASDVSKLAPPWGLSRPDDLAVESGPGLEQFGIVPPKFLSSLTGESSYTGASTRLGFNFGVSPSAFLKLRALAHSIGRKAPHHPNTTPKSVAERLKADLLNEIPRVEPSSAIGEFLMEFLLASSICEYAFAHVVFDDQGLKENPDRTSQQQERPFEIFSRDVPRATCAGFSKIVCEMSNSIGVKCSVVNGICRWLDGPSPTDDNHSWVVYEFKNGTRVPADPTPMFPEKVARNARSMVLFNWQNLPVTARSWELFMAMHWSTKVRWTPAGDFMDAGQKRFAERGQTNPEVNLTFHKMSKLDWMRLELGPYQKLLSWYTRYGYGP